jgi:hypothetical protein
MLQAEKQTIKRRQLRRREPAAPGWGSQPGDEAKPRSSPARHVENGTLPWFAFWIVSLFVAMLLTLMVLSQQLVGP